ncbi:thioredoxin-like protein [Lophiotrema nucula]|uniref:Thioredoxin-like protein n=1 Tax=Lophiotrema nucula TaxID=690887 RepID=A0A6A5YYI5_9PLEO|nr:thioredoxin-like protein [Lophiotrema nucula]
MAHTTFPTDIPVPHDDGACTHLTGLLLPSVTLPSTSGTRVDLSALTGLTILFVYPRTGAPNETITEEWNSIPGARGCTPQACGFRDETQKLYKLGVKQLFGVSTQDTTYQQEIKERVHLPYDLLSDERLEFAKVLKLPLLDWKGSQLIKRLALAVRDGKIEKVWYPVFPPDKNAADVVAWLESKR